MAELLIRIRYRDLFDMNHCAMIARCLPEKIVGFVSIGSLDRERDSAVQLQPRSDIQMLEDLMGGLTRFYFWV